MMHEILSDAMRRRVEELLSKDWRLTFVERIRLLVESEHLYENLPYAVRYGRTLDYILRRVTLPLRPDERLVGAVAEEIPSEATVAEVQEMSRRWWDIPDGEIQRKILWFYSTNWLRRRPPWFYSFGHLGLQWGRILQVGLDGFIAEAKARLARPDAKADASKREFLEGVILCQEALRAYAGRWAGAAADAAARQADAGQRRLLEEAAAACAQVAGGPARTFHEALQLLWLLIVPLMKVCGCGVFDLGRMDQYLLPFYRADVRAGRLTPQGARELLLEFFEKNNSIMSPADHMSIEDVKTDFTLEMTFDDPNYLVVGGLLADGSPGVNELSHLMVEAQGALCLRNPFMVVRSYDGIEEGFWRKVCAAMRDNATIVIYNDQTMIPALKSCGVRPGHAVEYGFYGCNDPDIPGMQGGLRQLWFNLLLPLQLALSPGLQTFDGPPAPGQSQFSLRERMIGLMTGAYHGVRGRPLVEIRGMDDLLEEYRRQVRFLLADFRAAFDADVRREGELNRGRLRIEDCFLDACVERALSWNDGGTVYNAVTVQGSGIASTADSLAAVREMVFGGGGMSLEALAARLGDDFAGDDDLQARLRWKTPKFGNDVAWVDELARRVVDIFCDEVALQNEGDHLYRFLPTLSTDRDFTAMGRIVGATPDGRRRGDPISENQSPTEGTDTEGLTALLNSVATLPFHRVTGGPLNLRIHPTAVEGDEGLAVLSSVLRTYMENRGMQVQVNVVSAEQLRDAQRHPDRYRGLVVRVTGYSAYFVQMGRRAQEEMIRRTEQG